MWSSFKDTITAACNKLPRAPKGQDTDRVTDEVRNLSKKKEAWVHLCNNSSIALQWDLTSAAERRRHWQFCTLPPVHSPKPSFSAHLKKQRSLCPRFSTWVAQCPKTVVTVLKCHPGLSKPRRYLAISTEGCGCRRGSGLFKHIRIKTVTMLHVFSSVILPTLLYGLEYTVLLELCNALSSHHSVHLYSGQQTQHLHTEGSKATMSILTSISTQTTLCRTFSLHE